MLRITSSGTPERLRLKLEGRLIGPWVNELKQAWSATAGEGKAVEVDLEAVSFADADGCQLLSQIEKAGTKLVRASAFLRQALGQGGRQPRNSGLSEVQNEIEENGNERTLRI